MDVSVRQLESELSAYLSRAATGEILTVTDRGRPIAVIGPPPGHCDLKAAADAGWVRPPSRSGLVPLATRPATGTVFAALAEDRDE